MEKERLFKLFSSRARREILMMVLERKLCVTKITEELGLSQPTVTQHLRLLREAGLVKSSKIGSWVHYSPDLSGIRKCLKELRSFAEKIDKAAKKKNTCSSENCIKKHSC